MFTSSAKHCRVCFENDQDRSSLISPCDCRGSSLYIHEHCLDQWQETALQSNLPDRATTCPICKCKYRYPSLVFMIYRRCVHIVRYHVNVGLAVCSLLWLSFVTIPLKIFVHTLLVIITLPFGSFSLNGKSLTWIGYDFPPQLALVHDGNGESVPELRPGVLLVATRIIPQSSIFYKSVVLILEHSVEFGSKGVIINSMSKDLNVSGFAVGNGGPMEQEMCTVVHNSRVCSRYSYVLNEYEGVYVSDCENAYPTIRQLAFAITKQLQSRPAEPAPERNPPACSRLTIPAVSTASVCPGDVAVVSAEVRDRKQHSRRLLTTPSASRTPDVRVLRGTCAWIHSQLDGEVLAGLWHILPGSQSNIFASNNPHLAGTALNPDANTNIGQSLYGGNRTRTGASVHDTRYWELLDQLTNAVGRN